MHVILNYPTSTFRKCLTPLKSYDKQRVNKFNETNKNKTQFSHLSLLNLLLIKILLLLQSSSHLNLLNTRISTQVVKILTLSAYVLCAYILFNAHRLTHCHDLEWSWQRSQMPFHLWFGRPSAIIKAVGMY